MMARHSLLLYKFDRSRAFATVPAGLAVENAELLLGAASSCVVAAAARTAPLLPAEVHAAYAVVLQLEPRSTLLQR